MDQKKLCKLMTDHPWKDQIRFLHRVDSTNRAAQTLADEGASHGTVVLADHQTAGKGRFGRSFCSPEGLGIYCSVVLRFRCPPEDLFLLTPMAAEATRRAIVEATGFNAGIKWINDLVAGNKKLCGILTQLRSGLAGETAVILGIGINCDQKPEDFPPELRETATSLLQQLGQTTDRETVTAALLHQVFRMAQAIGSGEQTWMDSYRANCLTLGKDVQLLQNGTCRMAHVDDLDDRGALLVTLADGTRETVFSGEVSVRGLYGYV